MKIPRSVGELFDLWAAPVLLVVIASNQIRLASTADLTPWKGGGFGMFASIDDPGARTIRCEAEDLDGNEVWVDVTSGSATRGLVRRLRCFPDRELLRYLGELLVRGEFVAVESSGMATLEAIGSQNPGLEMPSVVRTSDPVYRLRSPDDPAVEDSELVRLRSVRLRMFRLRFGSERARRWCDPIGDPVVVQAEEVL